MSVTVVLMIVAAGLWWGRRGASRAPVRPPYGSGDVAPVFEASAAFDRPVPIEAPVPAPSAARPAGEPSPIAWMLRGHGLCSPHPHGQITPS